MTRARHLCSRGTGTSRAPKAALLILAAAGALAGCAGTLTLGRDEALALVPYTLQENGRIIVDVHLDERGPYPFALDTAATISFIFEGYRNELALEPLPDATRTVHGVVTSGRFPLVRVDRLRVHSEIWAGAELVSLPGDTDATSTIAGILGIDFLRRYGIGFSTQDRIVRLYPPAVVSARAYRGWVSVPLVPMPIGASREPLYFLDVRIGDHALPALFDLGAGVSLMNAPAARHLRLTPRRVGEETVLSGALGSVPVLARLDSGEVVTATVGWRNETFLITDAEIFATLEHAEQPLAILGAGLFSQRDFVIDFARERLLIRSAMGEVDGRAE